MKKITLLWIAGFTFWWTAVPAQDFEFQLDRDGNAFYADSVEVLNQNLDSAFAKLSVWATAQVQSEQDTLIFTQSGASTVVLRKFIAIKGDSLENTVHTISFEVTMALTSGILKYRLFDIYHLNQESGEKCRNLGANTGACEFANNPGLWEKVKIKTDQKLSELLRSIEFIMSAK